MDNISIELPTNLENMNLPDPALVTYYRNLDNRVIWLDTDVDNFTLEFSRMIMLWNFEDKGIEPDKRKPIKLCIASYGGDLDINNSLVSLIKLSKTPIYSYNMGFACSSAAFISMACHKRYAMPGSYYLLHKGYGGFQGTFDQVASEMEEYARKMQELAKFISEHSKIDEETLDQFLGTEWYIDCKTALELGVCDAIIDNIDDIV